MARCLLVLVLACLATGTAPAADEVEFTRKQDVVYGRKHGTALTMDVIAPKKDPNGLGLIWVVSGGWYSNHDGIRPANFSEFLKRGYTIFAVVHGSQPKFTIPEILEDMHRSVRFIRAHAKDYGIDPERIGVMGGSAGGHLSCMLGTTGDDGDPKAKDPVERASCRVQAVACFFPPTDFLNYGEKGKDAIGRGTLSGFKAPFDFHVLDKNTGRFERITDEENILKLGRKISPITHATSDDAPTLIIHGDQDKLVPIQQAEVLVARLKELGVSGEVVVRPGAAHGWKDLNKDMAILADWFDKYLAKKK